MAGWDRNADWNRDVLEHIAALLFALAGLAELAGGLPVDRRRQLLGILSYGEAEARAFVIGTEVTAWPDVPESAADAALLAASFRALALALCAMLAYAARLAAPSATSSRAGYQMPAEPASWQAPRAPDTS